MLCVVGLFNVLWCIYCIVLIFIVQIPSQHLFFVLCFVVCYALTLHVAGVFAVVTISKALDNTISFYYIWLYMAKMKIKLSNSNE